MFKVKKLLLHPNKKFCLPTLISDLRKSIRIIKYTQLNFIHFFMCATKKNTLVGANEYPRSHHFKL